MHKTVTSLARRIEELESQLKKKDTGKDNPA
jgi:hypothetical protein